MNHEIFEVLSIYVNEMLNNNCMYDFVLISSISNTKFIFKLVIIITSIFRY